MARWTRREILKAVTAGGALTLPVARALAQSGAAALARAPKRALVIGNSRYKDAPLRNPENDAKGIATALQTAGFTVNLALDTGRAAALDAINAYSASLAKDKAVGVFYFAGHGAQLAWRNYLLPVDAHIEKAEQLRDRAVDLNSVIEGIRKAGNPMNVVIMDACRDNPFGKVPVDQKGLSQMDAPPGTLLAYATAPGNTASDGDGANGLYTENLLREILVPDAKIEDVFKRVRLAVRRKSNGQQIPWESTSLEEDFWFLPPLPLQQLLAQEREREQREQQEAWNRIKDADSPQPVEEFLRRYPGGPYAEQAQARLEYLARRERELAELKRKQLEAERDRLYREQATAWDKAKAADAPQALEDFLRRYPGGQFAEQATARLEFLAQREREQAELKRKQLEAERDRQQRELQAAWEKVKDATAAAPLEDFLRRYPSSAYTDQARARIDGLLAQQREALERSRKEAEERRAREQQEQLAAWNKVKDETALEPLEDFLKRYPGSAYAEQARARLEQMLARQREERDVARKQAAAERERVRKEQVAAWERVKGASATAPLEDFLRRYPDSDYAKEAQARLEVVATRERERRERDEAERQRAFREQQPQWEKIKDATTAAPVEEFLRRYPNGPFAEQAHTRLSLIAASQREARELSQKEQEARREREYREQSAIWEQIKESSTPEPLEAFLRRYPSGPLSEIAQARLDNLLARQGEKRIEVVSERENPYTKGTARANTAYKVGDRYFYRVVDTLTGIEERERRFIVENITDTEIQYRNGATSDLLGNMLTFNNGSRWSANQIAPAEFSVGKRWNTTFRVIDRQGRDTVMSLDLRIVGKEVVKVPAGEFEAFFVIGEGWRTGGEVNQQWSMKRWYAPDRVRHFIASELLMKGRGGAIGESSRTELTSFRQS